MLRPRWTLATRLSLILCGVCALVTAAAIVLQERALSVDLERAARVRLERAATAAEHLLDGHLDVLAERYHAVSRTPEFRANLEVGHARTLAYFGEELLRENGAALIAFADPSGRATASAGDDALTAAALAALERSKILQDAARQETHALLLVHDGAVHAMTVTPLRARERLLGRLLAIEAFSDDLLHSWSNLTGARVSFEPAEATPQELEEVVLAVQGLDLRVAGSLAAEREALVHVRQKLLAAGAVALGLAFALSFVLARQLVRPIVALRQASERLGRGDLSVRLGGDRSDELGEVARAFDQMAERLDTTLGEVRYLAYHDGLTGLGNRRLFVERLGLALDQARRVGSCVAVLFLDLDHFKYVNDTLGHTTGDRLLAGVADRIVASVKQHDSDAASGGAGRPSMVCRFGGDEFAVLATGIAEMQQAGSLAWRILEGLARPFDLDGHDVTISASVGISAYPDDGADAETLLRNCDTAMYHAKQQGRNSYRFFARFMNEIAFKRLLIESRLRRALERDELELHYQPKVAVATGRVTGVEALVRWHDPELGTVSPEEFVPLAEESGLITPIGDWVMREAVRQLAEWQSAGVAPLHMAVNLSTHQIRHAGLPERVASILAGARVDARFLELEITETALMQDEDASIELLSELRDLGVGLSLDDFGTGYSSLSYLRRLPIDAVKIDQSFIQRVGEASEDADITAAIIALVRVLRLRVVVEGVQTEEQASFLREVGCDEMQGYLLSAPVPAEHVPHLVESLHRERGRKRGGRSSRGQRRTRSG